MPVIRLQDPLDPIAPILLEELLAASDAAKTGGAIFAYARSNGADLLLRDSAFQEFLKKGRFDLVVGVDGVTDVKALERLAAIARESPRLKVRVFLHEKRATTFHPKVCWFRKASGGVAIIGSGNLTLGGLTTNWECFGTHQLTEPEARGLEAQWQDWLSLHGSRLFPVDEPSVRARAARNKMTRPDRNVFDDIPKPTRPAAEGEALLVEIPKASDRWNQANIDHKNFRDFFHADDAKRRLRLWHISDRGVIASEPELRPGVAVKSRNFRIELKAAAKQKYPANGRPMAAFVKTGPRDFLYMLLMPGNPHFDNALEILKANSKAPATQVRRARLSVKELQTAWPGSPLWTFRDRAKPKAGK
jgi:hypothetical protein